MVNTCNYWYAGTNLIDMSQSRLVCSCGIEVRYKGELLFYNPVDPPAPNMKELVVELKQKHFPLQMNLFEIDKKGNYVS